jgi:glycine/serine hydroxymethyltransferase
VILTDDQAIAAKLNSSVFPGQQGRPLEHVIAAKAVAFKLAASEKFRQRQKRTLADARIIAERLTQPDAASAGVRVLTGGTDVHLVLAVGAWTAGACYPRWRWPVPSCSARWAPPGTGTAPPKRCC